MHTTRRAFLHRLALTTGSLALRHAESFGWMDGVAGLPRSTPAAEGVDVAGIEMFLDAIAAKKVELHSFMLVRHGRVIAEGWWQPYAAESRHGLYSLSKSFTSTAVGFLVADGKLSVEDKVVRFFPNDLPAEVSANLAAMRVKDLLTMSAGHAKDPTFAMVKERDWLRYFLAQPVEHQPGTRFVYNSGATYTLSAIVQEVSGKPVLELLEERLFAPLGIAGATWEMSPQGICTGGWGLSVPTEALAKFAQLYLQKGEWKGKQLIPAAWVAEATQKHVQQPIPDKPRTPNETNDWLQGYGYQFWRCQHGGFRGDGAFGQLAVVLPEQDAVLAVTAELCSMQGEMDLIWAHLLPAMKAKPLPADEAAQARLRTRLAALALPLPTGVESATAARIAGMKYRLEKNDLGLESVTLTTFTKNDCTIVFRDQQKAHTILCGLGAWTRGETALPGTPPSLVKRDMPPTNHVIATAGAWTDDATFEITLRFYETPHHDRIALHFDDQKVRVSFLGSMSALSGAKSDGRKPIHGTSA